MSWIRGLLGLGGKESSVDGETDTVRRIVGELEAMEPSQARYLAAFAYILSRVANADLHISSTETGAMEEILQKIGMLTPDQAALVVGIAKSQNRLLGETEDFLVTREFKEIATREQCEQLVDCLFAVSAADDSISVVEDGQIRQISSELGFSLSELNHIRSRWADQREVLRRK
jgi:uncharacterized tellurite resistance protein B-like protein